MTETSPKSFYITTAISYPNGAPHIGHAYEALATDAIARFKRLDGYDVKFLTGTDEHGLKIQQTADKAGISPQAFVDSMAPQFQEMVAALGCTNDDFIRTTEERHKKSCQELWRRMEASGDIYKSTYAGWYSVRDEAYYQEAETELNAAGTRIATSTQTPVEWMEESSYFFRLSKYQQPLLDHYAANQNFILPDSRRNEIVSFVKGGLQDLSISRTNFKWGIPVPGDEEHVMYVWVDALTNYLTGIGFPDETYKHHWPADMHIIGKDITRFHAVYWPAFLMSAGIELPKMIFGHGFLTNRGEKMSKSLGNVVSPADMIAQYGVDAVRYYFLSEIPFGNDGSYSHEAIVNRVNADLANNLGNLAQRSLSMIQKNCEGVVPRFIISEMDFEDNNIQVEDIVKLHSKKDWELLTNNRRISEVAKETYINACNLHYILEDLRSRISDCNVYFTEQAPWALKKTNPERMEHVLWVTAETLRLASLFLQPFIPETASKLLDLLAVPENERTFAHATVEFALKPGTPMPEPTPIFPRLEMEISGAEG